MPRFNSSSYPHLRFYRYIAALAMLLLGVLSRDFWHIPAPLLGQTSAYVLPLLCCFGLSLLRRYRVFAVLCACFALGLWRADMALPSQRESFACTGIWQVENFPRRHLPLGQILPLRLMAGDCPPLRGQSLHVSHYLRDTNYAIGDSFAATLQIRPGKRKLYAHLPQQLRPQTAAMPMISAYRTAIARQIDARFPQHRAWVRALLIGDRSLLSQRMRGQLQISGTSHLLAISGLHLAVMMGVFYWLFKMLTVFSRLRYCIEPHSLALCAALFGGLAFVLISGAQAPILRAWIMFVCLLLLWLNLPFGNGMLALGYALFVIVIIEPLALFSFSIWLSFCATAAVILTLRLVKHLAAWRQWLAIQGGITLVLTPLLWSIFGGISLISIAVNLLVVPWLAVILCLLLAALVLPALSAFAAAALDIYLRPIELAAQMPFAYIEPIYQMPLPSGVLASIACLCLLAAAKRAALLSLLLALACALPPLFSRSDYVLTTSRIPAAILYPPSGAPILLNTAYQYRERNDARRYLLPVLRQRFQRPQAIVISHDSRHALGGIADLLAAYPDTPIYTLSLMPELSFAHQYCPEHIPSADFYFKRGASCSLFIGNQSYTAATLNTALRAKANH